jgi:hypothetical protein
MYVPLTEFYVVRNGYVVVFVVPNFLRAMTIIKLEECWRVGNKKAPKVCCHSQGHNDSLGASIHMVFVKRINFNI